jgi:hypothetical protein
MCYGDNKLASPRVCRDSRDREDPSHFLSLLERLHTLGAARQSEGRIRYAILAGGIGYLPFVFEAESVDWDSAGHVTA